MREQNISQIVRMSTRPKETLSTTNSGRKDTRNRRWTARDEVGAGCGSRDLSGTTTCDEGGTGSGNRELSATRNG